MSDSADSLDPKYKRVLLKLSGEALSSSSGSKIGINPDEVQAIAGQLARVAKRGVQLAVVIGGEAGYAARDSLPAAKTSSRRLPITWECLPP